MSNIDDEKISNEAALDVITAVMERQVKRLFILCLIIFAALVISNAAWIYYESSFEDVTTTVSQETSSEGGGDAIINGENAGAVFYGESKTNDHNEG